MGLGGREGTLGSHVGLGVTWGEMNAVAMGVGCGTGRICQAEMKVARRGKLVRQGPLGEWGGGSGWKPVYGKKRRGGELFFLRF